VTVLTRELSLWTSLPGLSMVLGPMFGYLFVLRGFPQKSILESLYIAIPYFALMLALMFYVTMTIATVVYQGP
jgi:hypothetical protein